MLHDYQMTLRKCQNQYTSFGRFANFTHSDRCEIYTGYWPQIEVWSGMIFREIEISVTTINGKPQINKTRIRSELDLTWEN